ncbi:response regulator, partial [Omnitrophica bacterium]|nr:response regulator [Candidatus Omnitrophota bacterium]
MSLRIRKILIADDQEIQRKVLEDYFRLKKIETVSAASARQMVERARIHKPDVIIADLNMPV